MNYEEIIDKIDIEGKFEFENENEIRKAMLKLYQKIEHLFDKSVFEVYLSVNDFDNLKSKEITDKRAFLWELANEIKDYERTRYSAIRALICFFSRPLSEKNDSDLSFTFNWCLEFCIESNPDITNFEIIEILENIK